MNTLKNILLVILIIVVASCGDQNSKKVTSSDILKDSIQYYLKNKFLTNEVPGAAVAIIKNNEVIYKGYFGVENLESRKKVNNKTIFPVYSTTKLVTATAIFKLIEQGTISLEDPISIYVENLPKEWQNISIKNLLTHSSGLPDFSLLKGDLSNNEALQQLFKKPLLFEKGEKWKYNQTNYWFLAMVIEEISKKSFAKYILENQFNNVSEGVLFTSDLSVEIPNRVYRYDYNNELSKFDRTTIGTGSRAHACNGLNITLDEYILWDKRFNENAFIKEKTKKSMWQPFKFENDSREFLHGWGLYNLNNIDSYGFTGGVQTGFRKFTTKGLTIILLTNGFKYIPIHNTIINHLAGLVDKTLLDKEFILQEDIMEGFLGGNFEKAEKRYADIKSKYPDYSFENTMNVLGYVFLRKKKLNKAIEIFKINTLDYPSSWNVYDSLGEAYYMNKKYQLSIDSYSKSLILNSENENAKLMIEKIKQENI